MHYALEFRPSAVRDLKRLPRTKAERILTKIEALRSDLAGDVKRLRGADIGYRLRVGDYRILFDADGSTIVVRRVRHRREAYGG